MPSRPSTLWQRSNLLLKYMLVSLPLIFFVTFAVLFAYNRSVERAAEEELLNSMNRLVDVQSAIVAGPLWFLNERQLDLVLQSLILDDTITGVAVRDDRDEVVATIGKVDTSDTTLPFIERDIEFRKNAQADASKIGTILVSYSRAELLDERTARLRFTVLIASVIAAGAVGCGVIAMRSSVINPLQVFLQAMQRNAKKLDSNLLDWRSKDEIGTVVRAYNDVQRSQREYQRQLSELTEQLEERVSERTQQLSHARDEANKANEAKSAFLATMSHEIRTPLNGIVGMSQLLESTTLSAEQQDYSNTIRQASDALMAIVNDVLDLSKIEAGALEVESIPIDLRGLISSCLNITSGRAEEKGLVLSSDISPDLPSGILGDPIRLRQILLNLINNAVKFTESGSVTVSAKRDGDRLRLVVADTGIGIPQDRLDRLFRSFSQVDASTTRRYGGTGLGLAIAKELIELSDGSIKVESQVGVGTSFVLTLPLIAAALPEAATETSATSAPSESDQPLNILLVDDNKINRKVGSKILSRLNRDADLAESGAEALEKCQNKDYDLVLMDIEMPEMDGITATSNIREQLKGRPMPLIVALTANAMAEERERYLSSGMDGYLSKPIVVEDLKSVLVQAGERETRKDA